MFQMNEQRGIAKKIKDFACLCKHNRNNNMRHKGIKEGGRENGK